MLYVCICMIRCGILLIELQQKKKITLRDRVWISDTIEYDNTQNPTNGFCNERNSKASLFRTELLQLLQKPEIMHRCDEYKFDSGESVSQVYWTFDAVNRVFLLLVKRPNKILFRIALNAGHLVNDIRTKITLQSLCITAFHDCMRSAYQSSGIQLNSAYFIPTYCNTRTKILRIETNHRHRKKTVHLFRSISFASSSFASFSKLCSVLPLLTSFLRYQCLHWFECRFAKIYTRNSSKANDFNSIEIQKCIQTKILAAGSLNAISIYIICVCAHFFAFCSSCNEALCKLRACSRRCSTDEFLQPQRI